VQQEDLPQSDGSPTHQGKTAAQWEAIFLANYQSPAARFQAAQALGDMSEAGFAPLFAGMRNRSAEIRLQALQALTRPVMVGHHTQTVPQLIRMLGDANPAVREQAAYRLSWFDDTRGDRTQAGYLARERLQALQELIGMEESREIRLVAWNSSVSISNALKLRPPAQPR
jgi:HEAT repeat protein